MSELKAFEVTGKALFGRVFTKKVYDQDAADKVIAELKDDCAYWKMSEGNAVNAMHETEEYAMQLYNELRTTRRALWLARADRAKAMYTYWHVKQIEGHLLCEHKWIVVERLCRAKADTFKGDV